MRFAHPAVLWALPVVLLLGVSAARLARRRRAAALAVFAGGTGRAWADDGAVGFRRRADQLLAFAALASLVVALARPMAFRRDGHSELSGVPYIVALDLSRSMLAADVRPSRWAAATNALSRFLESGRADRVGLVTFSGVAHLNAPLSFDTGAIRTMLRYTSPLTVDMDAETAGSDLGAAIERAGRYFLSNDISPRVVILVTDGEDSGEQLLPVARRWMGRGLRVCAVGVGTRSGAKVPRAQWDGAALNASGQEVVSRLNEANLRRVTALTGGRYFPMGERGEGFAALRDTFLRPLGESAAKEDLKNYGEAYQFPLGFAIACLAARFAVGAGRRRRPWVAGAIRSLGRDITT